MKRTLVIGLTSLSVVVSAAPELVITDKGVLDQRNTEVVRQAIKELPEYSAYTNALRKYEADYIQATNKIASVSDNNTRQALNKTMDACDDVKTMCQKLKKLLMVTASGDFLKE
jgi:hypothetical protein